MHYLFIYRSFIYCVFVMCKSSVYSSMYGVMHVFVSFYVQVTCVFMYRSFMCYVIFCASLQYIHLCTGHSCIKSVYIHVINVLYTYVTSMCCIIFLCIISSFYVLYFSVIRSTMYYMSFNIKISHVFYHFMKRSNILSF